MADTGSIGRRVRRRRRSAGLSQDELASRAGISRQAVGALEAGRHLPRVDAALGLARALGTSVEDLLAATPTRALPVLGGEVALGTPVRAARVGEHTVVVPLDRDASGDLLPPPDATIVDGRVELLAGADLDGFVVAGCDPALGVLASLAPSRGPGRLVPVVASPAAARLALTTGRAHAALVHDVAPLPDPRDTDRVHRLPYTTWRTGLAAPAGAGSLLLEALAGRGSVVHADAGDAAQAAYERAVGHPAASEGPPARSHLDAARRASADGCAAVTIEPAAAALGLAFHPLETHVVELWVDAGAAEHPGARVLGELLASVRLRARLSALSGYGIEVRSRGDRSLG